VTSPTDPAPAGPPPARRPLTLLPLDLGRGFLIGLTELVPGVSGSTIALIVGLYTQLLRSAHHVVEAGKALLRGGGWGGFRRELAQVDWRLIIPVILGMGGAVLLLAGPIHHLVESYPLSALGLFFGIVLVGIAAPLRMVRWSVPPGMDLVLLFGAGFAAAFILTGLGGGGDQTDPHLLIVFLAAAVAICALIIPGVSGSFLLLAMGLYAPTLQAVSEFDLAYIGVFAAGAAAGLISIVQLVLRALERIPRFTVVLMAGLMAGSLRALWPWQDASARYSTGDIGVPLLFMVVGAAFVLLMMVLDARAAKANVDKQD
jgi:putative membrane protein